MLGSACPSLGPDWGSGHRVLLPAPGLILHTCVHGLVPAATPCTGLAGVLTRAPRPRGSFLPTPVPAAGCQGCMKGALCAGGHGPGMAMRGLCASPALPGNAGLEAAVTGTGPLATSALVSCCGVAIKWGYGAWGHPGDKPALEGTAVQGVGWRVFWGPGDVRDTWWHRGWPEAAGP